MSFFKSLFDFDSDKSDKLFRKALTVIIGQKPGNIELYKVALRHSSATGQEAQQRPHNERLEYLGDAILGAVIAEYLFKKFPFKDEGFLTEVRSRIVNGESLNALGRKVGIDKLLEFDQRQKGTNTHKSMIGDALEALVGAMFLDKGFKKTKVFVLDRLIQHHVDIDGLATAEKNHKSRLIEWAQKDNRKLRFNIIKEEGTSHSRVFTAEVTLDNESVAIGLGSSKKKAEQDAAMRAIERLNLENKLNDYV